MVYLPEMGLKLFNLNIKREIQLIRTQVVDRCTFSSLESIFILYHYYSKN